MFHFLLWYKPGSASPSTSRWASPTLRRASSSFDYPLVSTALCDVDDPERYVLKTARVAPSQKMVASQKVMSSGKASSGEPPTVERWLTLDGVCAVCQLRIAWLAANGLIHFERLNDHGAPLAVTRREIRLMLKALAPS